MLSDNELKVSMDYSGGADKAKILQRFQMILHGKLQTRSKFKMVMGYLVCDTFCYLLFGHFAAMDTFS